MSAFGNQGKDAIVDAIREFAENEIRNGASARQVIEHIMDAVTYGINEAMYELEKEAK